MHRVLSLTLGSHFGAKVKETYRNFLEVLSVCHVGGCLQEARPVQQTGSKSMPTFASLRADMKCQVVHIGPLKQILGSADNSTYTFVCSLSYQPL